MIHSTAPDIPTLASLDLHPYLDGNGQLPESCQGMIGVYAIFDQAQTLQLVGYSRDAYLSLKQHLVRQPQRCYSFKVHTISRPQRSTLEAIQTAWIQENGTLPPGNAEAAEEWTPAIEVKPYLTEAEQQQYEQEDELGRMKLLKSVARRVETEILAALKRRGVQMPIRFDPKAKEKGILQLKA
ncbi:GIY-YIG nuclease family protein [Trichothermofontia sp.]